jgi:YD repeat-containing protein
MTWYTYVGGTGSACDAPGQTTAFTYDAQGRLIGTIDSVGEVTTLVYDSRWRRLP